MALYLSGPFTYYTHTLIPSISVIQHLNNLVYSVLHMSELSIKDLFFTPIPEALCPPLSIR